MSSFTEQRKFKRWDRRESVEVFPIFPSYGTPLAETHRTFFQGQLRDLSEAGLGLTLETHLLAGSVMKFNFDLRDTRSVEIYGTVVWSKDEDLGVRFISLTGLPQRVIRRYLSETIPEVGGAPAPA